MNKGLKEQYQQALGLHRSDKKEHKSRVNMLTEEVARLKTRLKEALAK